MIAAGRGVGPFAPSVNSAPHPRPLSPEYRGEGSQESHASQPRFGEAGIQKLRLMSQNGPKLQMLEYVLRLYQLFYGTALMAASVNLFGLTGIAVGAAIVGAWYYVYAGGQYRRSRAFELMVAFAILFMLACCLFPAVSTPRHYSRHTHCNNCVKSLAIALNNYESKWKELPPAITYDSNGKPMHSWRVLILPHLEEERLYKLYSFDEPWDGPNNSKLMSQMPRIYGCPFLYDRPGSEFKTSYRVLIDQRTCFPPNGSRRFDEIRDGLSNTLLVVESNQPVPWMAPIDPTVSEYLAEMKAWPKAKPPHHYTTLLTHCDFGGCFAMADFRTFHTNSIPDKPTLEKLAFVNDGALTESELEALTDYYSVSQVRWEGYLALAAFFGLAFLPAFWLVPRQKQSDKSPVV